MNLRDGIVITSITGDLRQGGTLVDGFIDGDTDLIQEGDNIRLTGAAFAGFDDLDDRAIFNGHALFTPSFDFTAFGSQAAIQLGTANYLLRAGEIQDVGYTEQGSPANDHQIAPTMRISSAYNHSMQRHCNFVFDATETPDGIITDRDIETSDTALTRLNVYGGMFWAVMLNQLGGGEEGGSQFFRPYYSRQNKEYYQPAPHFQTVAPTSKGTLTKDHLRGSVKVIVRNSRPEETVGQVQIVAYATSDTHYEAKYPTLLPTSGRILTKKNGIWADSQARANTLAQNLYEWHTRPYTLMVEVDPALILFGDDGLGIDIADKIHVTYDGPTEDGITGAGVHVDIDLDFFVYNYSIQPDPVTKTARGFITLEADN